MTDAKKVRAVRDALGIGVMDARKIVKGYELLQQLRGADSIGALKPILRHIIHDLYPGSEHYDEGELDAPLQLDSDDDE
jgi:hypothetical protein